MLILRILEELLIDFCELVSEHSGKNMAEAVWQTMVLYGLVGKVHVVFLFRNKVLIMITNRLLQSLWTMRATMTHSWCLWSNDVRNKVLGFQRGRLTCAVCHILSI